jgi:3-deoxy-7-phosphoheptulonate synthase
MEQARNMSKHALSVVAVVFERDAAPVAQDKVLGLLGLSCCPDQRCRWFEETLLTIQLADPVPAEIVAAVGAVPGVRRALHLPRGRRLHHLAAGAPRSPVRLGPAAAIGAGGATLIAGPCSVESEAQVCEIALAVKDAGASALRGGAFKPRTSPYDFGGLGDKGLEYLARAREKSGLPIVTEALDTSHLDAVAQVADMVQIGSRNMHNSTLLFRAGAHPLGKPVLLKRAFSASIDELLEAAEYFLLGRFAAGHAEPGIVLCERGVRLFDDLLRFSLDISAFPVLRARTHLPIVADPSHPAGAREFVTPLALAAVAAGADGLLVEVAGDPDQSWCDGAQCLPFDSFRDLARKAQIVARAAREAPPSG